MRLLIAAVILALSMQADAAVKTIQVTLGASATQISTVTQNCRWVLFQDNATHNIRVGDINTTSSRGIAIAANGGAFFIPPAPTPPSTNLYNWYIVGTTSDVIDVVCDTVGS
jgi:hypothetical protein